MAQKKTIKALNKVKAQNKTEDFAAYLNYVISGQVEGREHAAQVSKTSKRTATLSDATILAKVMAAQIDQKMTQLMDVIQVQNRVLEKLGATEEMFDAAEAEYNEELAKVQKELEARADEAKEKSEE